MKTPEHISDLYELFLRHGTVTTDSRDVPEGAVFFALRGDNFDGNRYAAQALDKGAAVVVVDDADVYDDIRRTLPAGKHAVPVDDSLAALQALATLHRQRLGITILAITGTNGKTTTKELAAAVLSRKYRVAATRGNLNNHIGVPLTLLSMTAQTELGIVEMGASARGEIAALCAIAAPDIGIITNVGRAHLEGFGGEEGVRRAKGELYDYLADRGFTALVREDDAVLSEMAHGRQGLATEPYRTSMADGYESALTGDYNRHNIAAAIAAGRHFGVADNDIRDAIRDYSPTNHRSQRVDTGRNTVILDCYNANPSSMRAAIENFHNSVFADPSGAVLPKIIILGDMFELGRWSDREHAEILNLAHSGHPVMILLAGEAFRSAAEQMPSNENIVVEAFADSKQLGVRLAALGLDGYAVLVKASRGMALESVMEYM